jgi:hypothetical protein
MTGSCLGLPDGFLPIGRKQLLIALPAGRTTAWRRIGLLQEERAPAEKNHGGFPDAHIPVDSRSEKIAPCYFYVRKATGRAMQKRRICPMRHDAPAASPARSSELGISPASSI